ncbi:gamma-glutamylcyclotransferase family protein [Siccirubricoccus phaeus]|uniref:gamma-glutamylcyclotransferase family protein n=1 Tax=Siccirubricoccus phaeus TaxID=2595053 RepID=UPI0011F15A83|nr:gamma-glutamylcyclotransferase family protein [Siccirubricoccus phaeus]
MDSTKLYLFACGSFKQAAVQEQVFGRQLAGKPDALVGFCREPFVRPSGILNDRVDGMVFEVTDADLAAADAYEPPNYRRSKVRTASGLLAWVYLRQS